MDLPLAESERGKQEDPEREVGVGEPRGVPRLGRRAKDPKER